MKRYGFIEPDNDLDRWLRWAEDAVERTDPLLAVRKEIDSLLAIRREAEYDPGPVNKPR